MDIVQGSSVVGSALWKGLETMVTLYVLFVDSPNNHFRVVLHSIVKTTMEVMKTRLQALVQRLLKDIDEKGEYIIKIRLEEWTCKIKV